MQILIAFICSLFLMSGCEGNLEKFNLRPQSSLSEAKQIQMDDILDNGGLSVEFEQLQKLGIKGYMKDSYNNVIFYVDNPNETARKRIEKGLIQIFG
ncbi:hypothetical protein ACFS6G_16920 [Peribacillus deserti]